MLIIILLYLAVGSFVGIIAGLLGVGGGLVIIPILHFTLAMQGVNDALIQHLALGTSLASIMFTSISSFRAHNARGAVLWREIVSPLTPGIITGTLFGSWVAAGLPAPFLKIFFLCFLYWVSVQMMMNFKAKASRELPKRAGMFGVGNGIGLISSLVGIGGGLLSVPFMTWCNVPIHKAIGTSAAVGFPIAVAGTIGYILNGLGTEGLPSYTLGYVYLPGLFGIVTTSMITAPIGVKLAHSLPVLKIKRIFAVLLFIVGTQMLFNLLYEESVGLSQKGVSTTFSVKKQAILVPAIK